MNDLSGAEVVRAPDDPAHAQPMIALSGAELHLASASGDVNILRGIDLTVAPGERLGVVGPSGSGKSTMMMVMAGLERLTGGSVHVGGEDLSRLDEDALARFRRRRVGVVFQAFHLIPTMNALENVAVPLEFAGEADAFARARKALRPSGSDTGSITIPPSCQAASNSGSRSRARSHRDPTCCWPTSRPETWTAIPARRSSRPCSTCHAPEAPRSS